jgi:cold shock CspA family protein
MSKSQPTFSKKEKEKKKKQKRIEKIEKMELRKSSVQKGKSLEDMIAYIDENGNLSSKPPDFSKVQEIKAEDISVNGGMKAARQQISNTRKGKITYFNDAKGYGFINDHKSQQRIFVHINNLTEPLKEQDEVFFEIESGPKGDSAVNVRSK